MDKFWRPEFDLNAEVTLKVLGGELSPEWECMYCGLPLCVAANDGYSHQVCDQVVNADWEAHYVHDDDDPEMVIRRLLLEGKCSWAIRYRGWDGGAIYCGQDITDAGEEQVSWYCVIHQADAYSDGAGAAEERCARTTELLEEAFGA